MLLALNLGNSHLQIGVFEGTELRTHASLRADTPRSEDEYALLLQQLLAWKNIPTDTWEGVIFASVVPSVTPILQRAIKQLTSAPVLQVGPGIKTGFPLRLDNPSELGADLAANAAGALTVCGAPAVIADIGCATSLALLDSDGAFIGCSILPGVQMSLDALHGAELLPELSVNGTVPALGKNTADSMRSGVLRGTALSVSGFYELYKKNFELDANTPMIVTGTYAEQLLPYLSGNVLHVPHLTLRGLCAIYRLNKRKI